MKIFKEILSKNKEKYIQDLEDLIRLSKYSTNSVQDYLSDKFTSLNCINDDFNYDPKSIDLVEEFANDLKQRFPKVGISIFFHNVEARFFPISNSMTLLQYLRASDQDLPQLLFVILSNSQATLLFVHNTK